MAVMPDKVASEKGDLLRALGAEVVLCPTDVPPDSPRAYYNVADRLTAEIPGAFQPNQYHNKANPQAHYDTTGPEIWEQTGGGITHLVLGVGTGGTATGTVRYLRERKPDLVVVGADPDGSIYSGGEANVHPYLVEGVGEDFWPTRVRPGLGQPLDHRLRPRCFLDHPAPGPHRGDPRRPVGRDGASCRAAGRRRDRRSPRDGRGDPARRRARLPLEGLLGRLDAPVRVHLALGRSHRRRRAAPQARGRRAAGARHRPAALPGARGDLAAARAPGLPAAGGELRGRRPTSWARSASAGS